MPETSNGTTVELTTPPLETITTLSMTPEAEQRYREYMAAAPTFRDVMRSYGIPQHLLDGVPE